MTYTVDHSEFEKSELEPKNGMWVHPDEWKNGGGRLFESDWDKAEFRIETGSGGPIESLAVNVKLSGRKVHVDYGKKTRVQITFVGDCEEDSITYGWLFLS